MRQTSPDDNIVSCRNCGKPMPPSSNFCPSCSQKYTTGKVKFRDFIVELIDNFFSLDARWLRTLKYIFVPGKLTKEFFLGRHRSYIHPIRVFLVTVAVFLYVLNLTLLNSDDDHFLFNDEFKLRLYKNYILNKINNDSTNYDLKSQLILDSISLKISNINNNIDLIKSNTNATSNNEIEKKSTKTKKKKANNEDGIIQNEEEFFVIKTQNKSYNLDLEDFKHSRIEHFIAKNKLQIDTPYKLLVASLRKVKNDDYFKDTFYLNEFVRSKDTLTYLTDWSDPLKISISFSGKDNYSVALEDIRQLTVDQIIQKFKVENFLDQLLLKQLIKFHLDRKGFINFLFGTILWILICFIPTMALFMKLFYIRTKRYYIEHIVFLLHYHISMILMLTIATLLDFDNIMDIVASLFLIYSFIILPYFGLKNYYNQSWVKTIIKGSIIGSVYITLLFTFILIGMMFSFFFY